MKRELLYEYVKQEFPEEIYGKPSLEMYLSIYDSLEYRDYVVRKIICDFKNYVYELLKRKFY